VCVTSPDEKLFFQIYVGMAKQLGVPFNKEAFVHLLQKWYRETGRKMQSVHPRDILKVLVAICEYDGSPPHMTPELIDEACRSYFV
jgi:hypothetical protein